MDNLFYNVKTLSKVNFEIRIRTFFTIQFKILSEFQST